MMQSQIHQSLYKARLHSPVDKLISLKKGTKAKEVHYAHGIAFLACESGPLKAAEDHHILEGKEKG